MKYFIDTEFLEGTQTIKSFGFKLQTQPTIDLVSIGIVAEDGREYYAVSKDFNLKEAWNRFDWKDTGKDNLPGINRSKEKVYWIRENVLKPIWCELRGKDGCGCLTKYFTNKDLRRLINKYGKTNSQIAEEIKDFCKPNVTVSNPPGASALDYFAPDISSKQIFAAPPIKNIENPEFYGYYCDYDWVVFCWLFGRMIDLPKGFPMYCRDLKQTLDEIAKKTEMQAEAIYDRAKPRWKNNLERIKRLPDYPKQTNAHNALADAKWNYELYKFLQTL